MREAFSPTLKEGSRRAWDAELAQTSYLQTNQLPRRQIKRVRERDWGFEQKGDNLENVPGS